MMELFEYNDRNVERYISWTQRMAICINKVGISNDNKKGSEIGLKGFVFLDILQRINYNLLGLSTLFIEFKKYNDIRFTINLIFRSCLSEVLTGLYLAHFTIDEDSFANEINVINLDYAKFRKFLIENEVMLTNQNENKDIEEIINNLIKKYIKDNSELFEKLEKWNLKKPNILRETSNSDLFIDNKHFKNVISDEIKSRVIKNDREELNMVYILYRYFSQYHHYSFNGRSTLSFPIETDMRNYWVSFMMINECVHIFCKIMGVADEQLEILKQISEEQTTI